MTDRGYVKVTNGRSPMESRCVSSAPHLRDTQTGMTPMLVVTEMKKVLRNMDGWFAKATAHAAEKKFEPAVLLQARLAPDMFPLVRQVQIACDAAKYGISRATGKEAPSHPDTETSFPELSARIASVIAFLDTVTDADFKELQTRKVTTPRWEGKTMTAADYLVEHALPNFFFHTTTTYALLRHNGLAIGKSDFLGQLSLS